jgi:adenylylsulfate kinase
LSFQRVEGMPHSATPPGTIWLTGLAASGKTTLSELLTHELRERGHNCVVLDGEVVRQRTGNRYGHSIEDRFAVLHDIVAIARQELEKGVVPVVATISHKCEMRSFARQHLGRMLEVYLDCAPSVCASRDYKGHYRRAYAGEYACFVGVTEPYETWEKADLVIDTGRSSVREASSILLAAALEFLGKPPLVR